MCCAAFRREAPACVCVCVCKKKQTEERGEEESIHAQRLLALDFRIRPIVTDACELIHFNLL